jgi:hypothetical protein
MLTRGNGVATSYTFDGLSRLGTLVQNPSGANHDTTFTFGYTPSSLSRNTTLTLGYNPGWPDRAAGPQQERVRPGRSSVIWRTDPISSKQRERRHLCRFADSDLAI